MPSLTGKAALAQMLIAEGVEYLFGNPGTSETPLLDVLQDYPQLKYIQALQEGTAVGMADGYARATGRPAIANIHIAGGLANGISGLYNAFRGGTPLVLTAGNSDTRMMLQEPTLSGDLVEMTSQFTKWSAEILHPGDVPLAMRRAFKEAKTPPEGPVFLSFPRNTMDETSDVEIAGSAPGFFRTRPDVAAIEQASSLLSHCQNPLIVVGDRVAQSGAASELVRVAERLGARVYAASYSEVNFPTSHPLYGGMLNTSNPRTRDLFSGADVVLAVGADIFSSFLYVDQPFFESSTKLIHLDNASWELEKIYATEVGILCDPRTGLAELAEALDQDMTAQAKDDASLRTDAWGESKRKSEETSQARAHAKWDDRPMPVERMMHELSRSVPANAIVANEAITSNGALMGAFKFDEPGDLYSIRGGALGWGMPGALGVQLANPDRPVLAIVGDGASFYTVQALWTASRYNIPVVYAICNNRAYRILKVNMDIYLRSMLQDGERESAYTGMDFANALDLAAMAQAMGVNGSKIEDPTEIAGAVEKAYASGKPALLDISIDGSL